ncbi:hypothetical protein F5Y19DRAFT_358395 [Xylariaceae sp. FL1651]|nr:hypothetical protein F5Y19DRAFT_358395 [Xylariaceae sp. FL1651]
MFSLKHLLTLLSFTGARAVPLTGHDFDFSVSYVVSYSVTRPQFSTSAPPKQVLWLSDVRNTQITLTNPDASAREAYYISFLAIPQPLSSGITDLIFPWIKTNQSVGDDGSLQIHYAYFDDTAFLTNEIHNATLHVWRQTPEVFDYITSGFNLKGQLARLLENDTYATKSPSLDFPRANIDLRVRNQTGLCVNDADDDGNSISVASAMTSACAAITLPTSSETSTAAGNVPTSATGDASSPTETPSAASLLIVSLSWTSTMCALALFVLAT